MSTGGKTTPAFARKRKASARHIGIVVIVILVAVAASMMLIYGKAASRRSAGASHGKDTQLSLPILHPTTTSVTPSAAPTVTTAVTQAPPTSTTSTTTQPSQLSQNQGLIASLQGCQFIPDSAYEQVRSDVTKMSTDLSSANALGSDLEATTSDEKVLEANPSPWDSSCGFTGDEASSWALAQLTTDLGPTLSSFNLTTAKLDLQGLTWSVGKDEDDEHHRQAFITSELQCLEQGNPFSVCGLRAAQGAGG